MADLKQYRLHLPRAIVRAFVGLCCVWGLAGLVCAGLGVYTWHIEQLGRAAVSSGTAQASAAIASVGPKLDAGIQASSVRLGQSLDNLDRQIATIGPVVTKAGPAIDNLSAVGWKAGQSLDQVNRLCNVKDSGGKDLPCGTLADVNRTLATVRGTFGEIEQAADHENRNLSTLDAQELELFDDFHATAEKTNAGLDTFDALLARPSVALMLDKGGSIMSTTDAVETKLTQCTLHPTWHCNLKSDLIFGAQVGGYLIH
jgi:ABC-type transporter Mla subunit MlaD